MAKSGDADINELITTATKTPLKALQVFSDSSNRAMIGSNSDRSGNTIQNEDTTTIERYVNFANNILEKGKLSNKYKIEQTPKVMGLKSIQDDRILFSTSTSNQFHFVKDVDCFVRCTLVLDLPSLTGPNDRVWNASRDTVVEDIIIKMHLRYQPPVGDPSALIGQCETQTFDLVSGSYKRASPIEIRAGEKFMIETRNLCTSSEWAPAPRRLGRPLAPHAARVRLQLRHQRAPPDALRSRAAAATDGVGRSHWKPQWAG